MVIVAVAAGSMLSAASHPMTEPSLRSFLLTRRAWLNQAVPAAVAAHATLTGPGAQDPGPTSRPPSQAATQPSSQASSEEDVAGAYRVLGLEFSAAERKQALPRIREQRQAFESLRRAPTPWHLDPALRFDPLPRGADLPGQAGDADWSPLADPGEPRDELEIAFASVEQLATWLRSRKVTSTQLTELAIARLGAADPKLLCVVTLLADSARRAAARADAEIAAGKLRGPLHGIPFGAKDLLAWPGAPTTFGAKPFADQVWNETATVLARLTEAGAVLVAKLSLGALAMGDLWFRGRTRNPWNPEQGSSGSSAGSAAAVAAGLLPFALGTETLGSIVSPCTRCGVTGLRPTFGTVSRFGAMPLSWTMDKIGVIARTAADTALVYSVIRGPDGKDLSVRRAAFPWRKSAALTSRRIGYLAAGRAGAAQEPFLAALRAAGASVEEVRLPDAPYRQMLVMLHAEAATAFDELTRDGRVRELNGQEPTDWPNQFRSARLVPAVEYLRAARLRTALLDHMHQLMSGLDAIVALPYTGNALECTNLSGHPAIVVPLAAAGERAPTSITVLGKLYGEADLIAIAESWQSRDQTHLRRPKLA